MPSTTPWSFVIKDLIFIVKELANYLQRWLEWGLLRQGECFGGVICHPWESQSSACLTHTLLCNPMLRSKICKSNCQ